MDIKLNKELIMQSDETIDRRGAMVNIINGAGITIQFVQNIIIHNFRIRNLVSANGGVVIDIAGTPSSTPLKAPLHHHFTDHNELTISK